ncbi:clustered-asparagine-rich protein-like [Leptopilina boulardi]|uniref:clustered-asparagine-rich protein-like n=1 Tax=Leptopilina boulardi TaxID=63433 RepID=UPI0021F5B3D6|nr:clustered-asparagine-rich protein-like [Leptopilina boulardi]
MQHVDSAPVVNLETHQQSVRQSIGKLSDTDGGYKIDSVKTEPIPHGKYFHDHQNLQSNQNHFSINEHFQKNPSLETQFIHGTISIKPSNSETTEIPHQNFINNINNNNNNNNDHHQYNNRQQYYVNGENQLSHQINYQDSYYGDNTERPVIFENKIKFPNNDGISQSYNYDYGHVNSLNLDQHLHQRPEYEFNQFRKPDTYVEHLKKPELFIDYHNKKPETSFDGIQSGFLGNWNHLAKPDNVYVITHEVAHMKTKHFPYTFQHPPIVTELPLSLELPVHDCHLKKARISPWKKIFHILGTAIPIGLLFAALTPKVVTIDQTNTTDPNIVLHKMKSDSMPKEHRAGRISTNRDTCEEKSICEMILEGAKGKSNLVQSALWNLSKKITDEIAQKNGLQEIFAAAKRKDCSSLTC